MIVLDTTVLVYAKGSDHPLREPCRTLISAAGDGLLEATTTVEVIQEFAHVRAQRRGRDDAVALAAAYAELFSPLLNVSVEDLDRGLAIFSRHDRLGAFDAVLAATALGIQAQALVSADTAFGVLGAELPHVVPDTDGVARLLARHG
jgi:predicted nucleic acid-binding protein